MLNLILPLNLVTGYIAAKMSAVTTDCSVSLNDGLDVLVAWSNDFEIRPRRGALRHLLPIGVRKDPALNDQQLNRVLDDTERFDRVTQDPQKKEPGAVGIPGGSGSTKSRVSCTKQSCLWC